MEQNELLLMIRNILTKDIGSQTSTFAGDIKWFEGVKCQPAKAIIESSQENCFAIPGTPNLEMPLEILTSNNDADDDHDGSK